MSGIASNIVLKEEVRDPMLLLLLTDRMWDSSSFKGSDMSQSPEFLLRGTVRALGLSVLVLPTVLSSDVGFAITVLLAPWLLAPITGGVCYWGCSGDTAPDRGTSRGGTCDCSCTVEVDTREFPATVASAGIHWPLAFINSICLKVSPSGKGMGMLGPVRLI
jgi:hypothetical protein